MTHLLCHKKMFSSLLLLFFLCSGNVFFYSTHVVSELSHEAAASVCSGHPDGTGADVAVACSGNSHQGGHHQEGESCCESHSHVSLQSAPLQLTVILTVSAHPKIEPAGSIPDVFLDRFIPPQNLA